MEKFIYLFFLSSQQQIYYEILRWKRLKLSSQQSSKRGIGLKAKSLAVLAVIVFIFSSVMVVSAETQTSIWREEMTYQSLTQFEAGGWTVTHKDGVSFSSDAIVLDGTSQDTSIHYAQFPAGISNWKVEDKSRWTLGSHCGNSVTAVTDKHSYAFMADGWYGNYVFYRDGKKTTFDSFQETKNEWYTLAIEKQGNQINMYYNGEVKSTYTETDTASSNLIRVDAVSPWKGGSEYDYFEVWQIGDTSTQEAQQSLLSNPIVIGGIIGAVGVGVGGVLYFFVLGGGGGAAGGASSSAGGGGLINQNHPNASSGELDLSPLSGESTQTLLNELYQQQISNISDITGVWQDFHQSISGQPNQSILDLLPLNNISSNLGHIVESILNPDVLTIALQNQLTQHRIDQGLLAPGSLSPSQENAQLASQLQEAINHGLQVFGEGTSQGSVNQDSYQDYLEHTTNLVDSLSQMINSQQTTTSNATHIQHQ